MDKSTIPFDPVSSSVKKKKEVISILQSALHGLINFTYESSLCFIEHCLNRSDNI